jgi:hypothetical protein
MLKEFAAFRKEICHLGFIGDLIAFEQAAQFFLYLVFTAIPFGGAEYSSRSMAGSRLYIEYAPALAE